MFKLILFIYTTFSLYLLDAQLYLGDKCIMELTGIEGSCHNITDCPTAVLDIQHKINPQICGFEGNTSIVCCLKNSEKGDSYQIPESSFVPSLTADRNIASDLQTGDRAKIKCKDYTKYITEIKYSLIEGSPSIVDCQIHNPLLIRNGNARPLEFPHMGAIGFDNGSNKTIWSCTGSLISEEFLLTAASCLVQENLGEAKYVRLGDLDLESEEDDAMPQDLMIIKKFLPPDYKSNFIDDIALLKLDKIPKLNNYIRPACLDTRSLGVNKTVITSGWTGNSTQLLQYELKVSNKSECCEVSRQRRRIQTSETRHSQICGNRDHQICQISGGPLQDYHYEVPCMYAILGLTSAVDGCSDDCSPIYTEVFKHIKWIEDIVWPI